MKKILFGWMGLAALLAGCAKDNYTPPSSSLKGRVVYQNQPVGVRSNGVQLELWQSGYQLYTKIPVYIDQDGSFSASLFDGEYKLVLLRGNGPWADNTDTLRVSVKGATQIDVPVQPYHTVSGETYKKSGTTFSATCRISKVVTTRAIERVTFYLGSTQFVDLNNNVAKADLTGAALADLGKDLSFTLPMPAGVNKNYLYGRIGVKTVGVAEMLYSPVQEIKW